MKVTETDQQQMSPVCVATKLPLTIDLIRT
jgi:hypothetical protein